MLGCIDVVNVAGIFFRKWRNPKDERNTIKSLVTTALIASILFMTTISAGLLKMYLDQVA